MWGFLVLGGLFVVIGALYVILPTTNAHRTIVVFYGICQLFYNLGKPCTFIEIRGLTNVASQARIPPRLL